MTRAHDPDDVGDPLRSGDGRLPKLVIVAVVWAAVGVVALLTAMLMRSAGFGVFGGLSVLAGGGLYLVQRAREQLEHDEARLRADPWGDPEDEAEADEEDVEPAPDADDTAVHPRHEHDDDIVDAEFTEYFDHDQAPADQDDGTGYDDEEVAYRAYRADQADR